MKNLTSCKDVFTKEEIKHLEEVLHGDLDGYWEEIKNIFVEPSKGSLNPEEREANRSIEGDFIKWKNFSNVVLKKCDLNEWDIPPPPPPEKRKTPIELDEMWEKLAKTDEARKKADDEMVNEMVRKGFY